VNIHQGTAISEQGKGGIKKIKGRIFLYYTGFFVHYSMFLDE
jgi:hypothetical protein